LEVAWVPVHKLKVTPLVSHSKDGEYIYETFLRFGMESVRGSSSRGGAAGFRALLKTLKEGRVPIFTPDGPRGPLYKLQEGVVQIAQITGLPVVYFNSIYDRYYEFKSWDKHRFPKLFAKQWILYSEPFYVSKDANLEEKILELENLMLEQVQKLESIRMENQNER
ncbi:MAG: lysophospholipid acyltransferase family protein, partial [Leptospiraceae bacterium]|nr:lysophospholipid acyltransferase family protein [Leptospiraceae bacterium]